MPLLFLLPFYHVLACINIACHLHCTLFYIFCFLFYPLLVALSCSWLASTLSAPLHSFICCPNSSCCPPLMFLACINIACHLHCTLLYIFCLLLYSLLSLLSSFCCPLLMLLACINVVISAALFRLLHSPLLGIREHNHLHVKTRLRFSANKKPMNDARERQQRGNKTHDALSGFMTCIAHLSCSPFLCIKLSYIALPGFMLPCPVLLCLAWSYVAMHGFTLLCLVLHCLAWFLRCLALTHFALSCLVLLRLVLFCLGWSYIALLWLTLHCLVSCCLPWSYVAMLGHTLPCPVLFCLALAHFALLGLIMPCLVLHCLALYYIAMLGLMLPFLMLPCSVSLCLARHPHQPAVKLLCLRPVTLCQFEIIYSSSSL